MMYQNSLRSFDDYISRYSRGQLPSKGFLKKAPLRNCLNVCNWSLCMCQNPACGAERKNGVRQIDGQALRIRENKGGDTVIYRCKRNMAPLPACSRSIQIWCGNIWRYYLRFISGRSQPSIHSYALLLSYELIKDLKSKRGQLHTSHREQENLASQIMFHGIKSVASSGSSHNNRKTKDILQRAQQLPRTLWVSILSAVEHLQVITCPEKIGIATKKWETFTFLTSSQPALYLY